MPEGDQVVWMMGGRGLYNGSRPVAVVLYRALFDDALLSELVAEIRDYLQQQKVPGTNRFRAWVEERTGRFDGSCTRQTAAAPALSPTPFVWGANSHA